MDYEAPSVERRFVVGAELGKVVISGAVAQPAWRRREPDRGDEQGEQ